jgi:CubicO group peptidase (beta-lactamase class C family)
MPNFGKDLSRNPFPPAEFIKVFWNLPLQFEPGTKFTYSNSGYFILGVIIEKITSKSYAQVVAENIFKPLGMTNSGYDMPGPILSRRAAGYQRRGGEFVNAAYLDMTVPYAAGSLYSTVEDLYLWDQALYDTKVLTEGSKAKMFRPWIATSGLGAPSMRYAFGWVVGNQVVGASQDSVFVISHGGGINGFNTLITRVPDTKTLVVLLNNTGGAPLGAMTESILGILYGKPHRPVAQPLADIVRETIRTSGIDAATARFNDLRTNKDLYFVSESQMNSLGYEYLAERKLKEAIAVFKLNVEVYPKSSNVYDSLGEAYAAAGEKDLAIKNYEKSVELDPKNEGGIEALKKLKSQ